MTVSEYIPKENFNLWYDIFKYSGGRLLNDPIDMPSCEVYVHYYFEDIQDANDFNKSFKSHTTPIKETNRGFWKRIKAKFKRNRHY